jgi:hypothetical protein
MDKHSFIGLGERLYSVAPKNCFERWMKLAQRVAHPCTPDTLARYKLMRVKRGGNERLAYRTNQRAPMRVN